MVCALLGKDKFREGLQLYMKRHAYGNTETVDLWNAWSEVHVWYVFPMKYHDMTVLLSPSIQYTNCHCHDFQTSTLSFYFSRSSSFSFISSIYHYFLLFPLCLPLSISIHLCPPLSLPSFISITVSLFISLCPITFVAVHLCHALCVRLSDYFRLCQSLPLSLCPSVWFLSLHCPYLPGVRSRYCRLDESVDY